MKQQVFKVGDLVRVPGRSVSYRCHAHDLPQGSVCVVRKVWSGVGDVEIQHPDKPYYQLVHPTMLKLAKQAMLQREALRLVKAGSLPTKRNKTPLANRMRKYYGDAGDTGQPHDIYREAASKMFGVPFDKVTDEQRLDGKIAVLRQLYRG